MQSKRVIAVANHKGGAGKTTLSMNLASGLSRRGRTLLVDADIQGSASQWADQSRSNKPLHFRVIRVSGGVRTALAEFLEDYQYIVVDCPPNPASEVVSGILHVASDVLVPVLPSPVDLWASLSMVRAIKDASVCNPALKARLVLNQVESRSALSREVGQALNELELAALQQVLMRRSIYRSGAMDGHTVYESGARGQLAVREIEAIIDEVLAA